MFHLALFSGSIATGANVIVPAVSDQILTIQDQGFLPQENLDIVAAAPFGTDMQHAYLDSPSAGVVTDPYLRPTNQGATFPTFGQIADYRVNPFRAKALESLTAYAQHDNVAAQVMHIPIVLRPNFVPAPSGDIYTMRGTSTTAATANAWSSIAMTWQNTLPAGQYVVVGMEMIGAAGIAARLILNNQTFRPGSIVLSGDTVLGPSLFRKGGLGTWGRFRSTDMPRVEVFATAATDVWTIYLDFVRVSSIGVS